MSLLFTVPWCRGEPFDPTGPMNVFLGFRFPRVTSLVAAVFELNSRGTSDLFSSTRTVLAYCGEEVAIEWTEAEARVGESILRAFEFLIPIILPFL